MAVEDIYKNETATNAATAPATGVDSMNKNMESKINEMYDANLASKKTQLENTYNQNLSNMQADKQKIGNTYQTERNDMAAEYEKQRRNTNLEAAMNGLNTGAGSQLALGQQNAYIAGRTKLNANEAEANTEADRQITNLYQTYQNDMLQAQSDNDAQRSAALLDEYSKAYDRINQQAKTLASYGDFSGYALLFGQETADRMKESWIVQNPDNAYGVGAIDANRYFAITGRWPAGYTPPETGGGGGDYGYYGGYVAPTASPDSSSDSSKWIEIYNQNTPATGGSKITAADYAKNPSAVAGAAQAAMTDYNNRLAAHYGK